MNEEIQVPTRNIQHSGGNGLGHSEFQGSTPHTHLIQRKKGNVTVFSFTKSELLASERVTNSNKHNTKCLEFPL